MPTNDEDLDWRRYDREVRKGTHHATRWAIAIGAFALVAATVVGSMWIFGWGAFQRSTAEFRGETGQKERTVADPNYRIAQYDHFFDLCASVQSDEATIQVLLDELATKPSQKRTEQINATLAGVRANRASSINQYNADARKAGTAGQFRASDLPAHLDLNARETSCTAELQ